MVNGYKSRGILTCGIEEDIMRDNERYENVSISSGSLYDESSVNITVEDNHASEQLGFILAQLAILLSRNTIDKSDVQDLMNKFIKYSETLNRTR